MTLAGNQIWCHKGVNPWSKGHIQTVILRPKGPAWILSISCSAGCERTMQHCFRSAAAFSKLHDQLTSAPGQVPSFKSLKRACASSAKAGQRARGKGALDGWSEIFFRRRCTVSVHSSERSSICSWIKRTTLSLGSVASSACVSDCSQGLKRQNHWGWSGVTFETATPQTS